MGAPPAARSRIVWLVTLAFLLRAALALAAPELGLGSDERQYLEGARAVVATGSPAFTNPLWDEAHSSPGYPYFLGLCLALAGEGGVELLARLLQALLGALSVGLVHALGRRAFDERTADLAALAAALYPTLIGFSYLLYSETLYTFLFLAFALQLARAARRPGQRALFAAGLVGGLAVLTRSALLPQVALLLPWVLLLPGRAGRRERALGVLALLAGLTLVVAPWSLRNTLRYDRFLLVDTNAGNVLFKNWNAVWQENHDVGLEKRWKAQRAALEGPLEFRPRSEEPHLVDRNNAEIRAAVDFVLRHPGLFAEQCAVRAAELLNPTSFVVRAVRHDAPPGLGRVWIEAIVAAVLLSTMAALGLGIVGLTARPPTAERWLLLLLVLGHAAVCVLVVSMSRYRLPIMPIVLLFAAHGALHWREALPPREHRLRWAALAVLAPLVLWSWIEYVPYSYGPG